MKKRRILTESVIKKWDNVNSKIKSIELCEESGRYFLLVNGTDKNYLKGDDKNKIISSIEGYIAYNNDSLNGLNEEEEKAVSMSTSQFEKNQDKVSKVAQAGYDIKLNDLKENVLRRAIKLLEKHTNKKVKLSEANTPDDFQSEIKALIKKIGKSKGSDWVKVKASIESAWEELKTEKVIQPNSIKK